MTHGSGKYMEALDRESFDLRADFFDRTIEQEFGRVRARRRRTIVCVRLLSVGAYSKTSSPRRRFWYQR